MVEYFIASKSHEKDVQLGLSGEKRKKEWKTELNMLLILSFPYGIDVGSNFESVVLFLNWNFSHCTRWKPFLNVWIPALVKGLVRLPYTM